MTIVQCRFTPHDAGALNDIIDMTDAENRIQAISISLRIAAYLVSHSREGVRICLDNEEKHQREDLYLGPADCGRDITYPDPDDVSKFKLSYGDMQNLEFLLSRKYSNHPEGAILRSIHFTARILERLRTKDRCISITNDENSA